MTKHAHQSSEETAVDVGLPWSVAQPTLVAYRSVGIGLFGAGMRFAGMPLEKIALYMNSSQVSGKNQFAQAVRLAFKEGYMAPYRVVGPASVTAWFLQYSVMGIAFQFVDQTLSQLFGVRPVYYGKELMTPAVTHADDDLSYKARVTVKTILSPILAASMESYVSNRAEVQRYFGPKQFAQLEKQLAYNPLRRAAGPAFFPSAMRNVIMCQTSFLLTPITYKHYFPQELKSKTTLFWYGLGLNIFAGNVVAITQQALWGRSLDYLAQHGRIQYSSVVQHGLSKDGLAAFFTLPKWFSRVLMNAPAQGTLPWFYNEVLPLAEHAVLSAVKTLVYDPFWSLQEPKVVEEDTPEPARRPSRLQRQRSRMGTLPTAHPDFYDAAEEDDVDLSAAIRSHHLAHASTVTMQPRRTRVTALTSNAPGTFQATSPREQ